jgi:hypothetical protein
MGSGAYLMHRCETISMRADGVFVFSRRSLLLRRKRQAVMVWSVKYPSSPDLLCSKGEFHQLLVSVTVLSLSPSHPPLRTFLPQALLCHLPKAQVVVVISIAGWLAGLAGSWTRPPATRTGRQRTAAQGPDLPAALFIHQVRFSVLR